MSLLDVFPIPKRLIIQGETYLVGQFQIKDLAALQLFLETSIPHPLDKHRLELAAAEGEERRKLLARLNYLDYFYPPAFDGREGVTAGEKT